MAQSGTQSKSMCCYSSDSGQCASNCAIWAVSVYSESELELALIFGSTSTQSRQNILQQSFPGLWLTV